MICYLIALRAMTSLPLFVQVEDVHVEPSSAFEVYPGPWLYDAKILRETFVPNLI